MSGAGERPDTGHTHGGGHRSPRLGFVGLGWIGAMRLDAVAAAGRARIAALCDSAPDRLEDAARDHPSAERFEDFDGLLRRAETLGLDGVVVATPNALHASQATAALDRGLAVFCQKPLGIDAAETRAIVDAARRADRLLGVDLSYRHTRGALELRRLIADGALGRVFRIESVFHNAYGPDKDWCRNVDVSGGGALMDLGVHQIDLPLWLLGFPDVASVRGTVFREGRPLGAGAAIDDFATTRIRLETDALVDVDVSWNAHAGADCVYRVGVFGTQGGAELRNVDGSFYEFELEHYRGRSGELLSRESRDWLGRAILVWVQRLADDPGFDPAVGRSIVVAETVDAIYSPERSPTPAGPGR